MEVSDMKNPPYGVFTFRDGHVVVKEDAESEVAAWTRFASAIDLCKTRDCTSARTRSLGRHASSR